MGLQNGTRLLRFQVDLMNMSLKKVKLQICLRISYCCCCSSCCCGCGCVCVSILECKAPQQHHPGSERVFLDPKWFPQESIDLRVWGVSMPPYSET